MVYRHPIDSKVPYKPLSEEEKRKYRTFTKKKPLSGHAYIEPVKVPKRVKEAEHEASIALSHNRRMFNINANDDDFATKRSIPESHIFLISDTGLLKAVNLANKTATNYYDGAQPTKEEGFIDICSPTSKSCFGITPTGVVKYFNNGKFHELMKTQGCGEPAFIDSLPNFTELKRQKFSELYEPTIDYSSLVSVFKGGQILFRNKKINDLPITGWKQQLTCGCVHKRTVTVAGTDWMPRNYDLATGSGTWDAKNVAHDWLDVKVPVLDRSIITDKENPEHCFYTATNYGHIRKYDMRLRGKPVLATSMTELGGVRDVDEIFTTISQSHTDKHLIAAGGNRGSMLLLDNRKFPKLEETERKQPKKGRNNAAVVKSYKPADGGVLSIYLSSKTGTTPSFIASCGNDRKLRVYNTDKGDATNVIYLKSKLAKLAVVESHDISLEKKRIADVATVKKEAKLDKFRPLSQKKSTEVAAKKAKQEDQLWDQLTDAVENGSKEQSTSSQS